MRNRQGSYSYLVSEHPALGALELSRLKLSRKPVQLNLYLHFINRSSRQASRSQCGQSKSLVPTTSRPAQQIKKLVVIPRYSQARTIQTHQTSLSPSARSTGTATLEHKQLPTIEPNLKQRLKLPPLDRNWEDHIKAKELAFGHRYGRYFVKKEHKKKQLMRAAERSAFGEAWEIARQTICSNFGMK